MWFYTIHMHTEGMQSQGCAYPNTIFCAKEQKTAMNILIFLYLIFCFFFLMGIIFFFSYTSWLLYFYFIHAFKYFPFFFPRKGLLYVHKYSCYIILPAWVRTFHIPIHGKLTSTQNLIHPPNHAATKQYLRSKHKYFALGMPTQQMR